LQPDPELIERLRRSGIRIDREGQFIHEGEPVRHEGLRQALFRWLDRLDPRDQLDQVEQRDDDVRYVLRLDERRFAYIDVDDTPLVVRALRLLPDGAVALQLSDGAEEPLDPATLTIDDQGVLRCWVRGGRIEARLATSAAAVLADRITETTRGPALLWPGQAQPQPLAKRRGSRP
jgi:hypothetical protein